MRRLTRPHHPPRRVRVRSSAARLFSAAICVALLVAGTTPAAAKPSPSTSAHKSGAAKQPAGSKHAKHSSTPSKHHSSGKTSSAGAPAQIICTSAPQTGSPTNGMPWAQTRLNFRRAWPISTGAGIKVAVIDSGIDLSHPQMAKIHVADAHNVIDGSTYVQDCLGHGTGVGVTGIIAGPPVTDSDFFGVAPGVTIVPVRQTDANGHGTSNGIAAGRLALRSSGGRR